MSETNNITIRQALNEAMREELLRDENVLLMGEDIAQYEGAYKITKGLLKEFGEKRVVDTPISEAGFAGIAIGSAYKGLRPVVEFMTWNFGMQAIDQICNAGTKIYYMSGGTIKCPVVFRGPNGPAARVAATHSQCLASTFANFPAMKIVMPSNPYNAKGLLKSAIRDDDVVIFLESEVDYGLKGLVPTQEYLVPLGKAKVMQEGSDLTIISMGRMCNIVQQACEIFADKYSIEIIDLQTIKPFDQDAIRKSVSKTHKVLCVEESFPFCNVSSELITWINLNLWDMLDQQPQKLAALDIPLPYASNLEALACPKVIDIQKIITNMLEV